MKIANIVTAGERCFCPGCVRELPLDNLGCDNPNCGFGIRGGNIPKLSVLISGDAKFYDYISPRFLKFLVAYGRATP